MNTKQILAVIVVLICCFLHTGCVTGNGKSLNKSKINHIVVCWLKEHGNRQQREKIIETSLGFSKIPGVIQVKAGEPVLSNRAIVDDSFDVAVMVTFANTNDMNTYLTHPIHIKAKNDILLPLTQKLLVYDFMEQ